MRWRPLGTLGLALVAALQLSCAVGGGTGTTALDSQPLPKSWPARQGLPAPYRPFFDALAEYGDWVLIEPYGWVFRPDVNFVAWRPYQDGYWMASDPYGWLWISNDPFGWITDHYGSWFYDRYQGWVWQPGGLWAPAWVAWVGAGDWIGWAPLFPSGYSGFGAIPGGVFTYAPAAQLAQGEAPMHASFVKDVGASAGEVRPITAIARVDGVVFNRGPDAAAIERAMGGLLPRASAPAPRRFEPVETRSARVSDERSLAERTRSVIDAGVRELTAMRGRGELPPPLPVGGAREPRWHTLAPRPGKPAESLLKPKAPADTAVAGRDSTATPPEAKPAPPRKKPARPLKPLKPRVASPDSTLG